MRVKGSTIKEDSREGVEERESRVEARARKSGRGQRRGPRRTGAKQRDCDGKQQPHLTSRAHGARKNGLNKEAEKHGECQDDKNTTYGRKKAGSNREASQQQLETEWTVTQPGREGVERMMSRAAPQRWVGLGWFRNTRE